MTLWKDSPREFLAQRQESRFLIVHPWARECLRTANARRVLDYGCGDGSLLAIHSEFLSHACLYDDSAAMRTEARRVVNGDGRFRVIDEPLSITPGAFDAVTLLLVLMCLPTRGTQEELLRKLRRAIRPGGLLLVAITHPCFRAERFSTFRTEFTTGTPFHYEEEGRPFTVEILGENGLSTARFQDYHWKLETTISVIAASGFRIQQLAELPDQAVHPFTPHPTLPPYIGIVATRE